LQIPFGSFLVPHILGRLPSRHAAALSKSTSSSLQSGSFSVNASKLHTQLVAYSLTAQITGAFIEIGVPYLKAKLLPKVQEKLHHAPAVSEKDKKESIEEHDDEWDFLKRVREEQLLPTCVPFPPADLPKLALGRSCFALLPQGRHLRRVRRDGAAVRVLGPLRRRVAGRAHLEPDQQLRASLLVPFLPLTVFASPSSLLGLLLTQDAPLADRDPLGRLQDHEPDAPAHPDSRGEHRPVARGPRASSLPSLL